MTKQTFQGSKLKKIRVSGYRSRMKSKSGQLIINARRKKGRVRLA